MKFVTTLTFALSALGLASATKCCTDKNCSGECVPIAGMEGELVSCPLRKPQPCEGDP
ncbi:hypothetical protein BKA59DRAFT_514167 [Fusarium tricinctum]|uniref:Uncharacterized protein n=1 Tax=Fusarium tricinctum TaxID=61284 RepID=A0A8K0RWE1_9HYPO|nr:hypothetical protein BKA59DRAFT_514167 [Fusarium tricinctum]